MTRTQENITLWLVAGVVVLVVAVTPIITAPLPDAATKCQHVPISGSSGKLLTKVEELGAHRSVREQKVDEILRHVKEQQPDEPLPFPTQGVIPFEVERVSPEPEPAVKQ